MIDWLGSCIFLGLTTLYWYVVVSKDAVLGLPFRTFPRLDSCQDGLVLGKGECVSTCPDGFFQYAHVCLSDTQDVPGTVWSWIVRIEETLIQEYQLVLFSTVVGILFSIIWLCMIRSCTRPIVWSSLWLGGFVLVSMTILSWIQCFTSAIQITAIPILSRGWMMGIVSSCLTVVTILYHVRVYIKRIEIESCIRQITRTGTILLNRSWTFIFPYLINLCQIGIVWIYSYSIGMVVQYFKIDPDTGLVQAISPSSNMWWMVATGITLAWWTMYCLELIRTSIVTGLLYGGNTLYPILSVPMGALLITISKSLGILNIVFKEISKACKAPAVVKYSAVQSFDHMIEWLIGTVKNITEMFTVGGFSVQVRSGRTSYLLSSLEWYGVKHDNRSSVESMRMARRIMICCWGVGIIGVSFIVWWFGSPVHNSIDQSISVLFTIMVSCLVGSSAILGVFRDAIMASQVNNLYSRNMAQIELR